MFIGTFPFVRFDNVVDSPQGLHIRPVKALSLLRVIGQIKRGTRSNMINVPSHGLTMLPLATVFPCHSRFEERFKMSTESFKRTSEEHQSWSAFDAFIEQMRYATTQCVGYLKAWIQNPTSLSHLIRFSSVSACIGTMLGSTLFFYIFGPSFFPCHGSLDYSLPVLLVVSLVISSYTPCIRVFFRRDWYSEHDTLLLYVIPYNAYMFSYLPIHGIMMKLTRPFQPSVNQ